MSIINISLLCLNILFFCAIIFIGGKKIIDNSVAKKEKEQLQSEIEALNSNYLLLNQQLASDLIQKKNLVDLELNDLYEKRDLTKEELDSLRNTISATKQAMLREQEIQDNESFYCLHTSEKDLMDIKYLKNIKNNLNSPRILSMLIWSTFYQKQLKSLSAKIIEEPTACGIYKITCLENQKSYIGQAVDLTKRFSEHAKAGLGIDTPSGNDLYKDMYEYGLEKFTWEILEKCKREELNQKERFYIELYGGVNYLYNNTKGNL